MWLKKLKIAIIEKNTQLLDELLNDIPTFKEQRKIEEAQHLLQEATLMVQTLQNQTADSMKKMKKGRDFLDAAQGKESAKFDITL